MHSGREPETRSAPAASRRSTPPPELRDTLREELGFQRLRYGQAEAGEVQFLFVTPERLTRDELIARLSEVPLDFVVIDEALAGVAEAA